jgi:hypothetical protein
MFLLLFYHRCAGKVLNFLGSGTHLTKCGFEQEAAG